MIKAGTAVPQRNNSEEIITFSSIIKSQKNKENNQYEAL